MEEYAGRVLADRYRLPSESSEEGELAETRAFDTYSGHEVLVRQVPLPEVVEAEVMDGDGLAGAAVPRRAHGRATLRPTDPAVLRAVEAAQAAARIPDHPRLDQVFDVFAEDGALWIVSEVVAARPLAALLAERPLTPYRAAEVASDVLTALRVLHAHGWTHRNITVRTVLVCEDGRVVLTGLASGAAEEALCGYEPVPERRPDEDAPALPGGGSAGPRGPSDGTAYGTTSYTEGSPGGPAALAPAARHGLAVPAPGRPARDLPALPRESGFEQAAPPDGRAAGAGAIAAYRAGARAAARPGGGGRLAEPGQGEGRPQPEAAEGPARGGFGAHGPDAARPAGSAPDAGDGRTTGELPGGEGPGDADGPGRARLAGTWHDAPPPGREGPGPLPAGGGGLPARRPSAPSDAYRDDPYGVRRRAAERASPQPRPALPAHRGTAGGWSGGADALRADAQRRPATGEPAPAAGAPRRDEETAGARAESFRGPTTPLAAERARQARITVVGAVTERWAPEQAGPVHENWQLAAPVGPATDLWALGALLYRAVQGHAPYPEDNAAELVQMVCAEPPAFAEECGPLRPVVESLLRQDPMERPECEELNGWLRSLVRSAPEPEVGHGLVSVPSGPVDPTLLPIVRRRGELVRRRRFGAREAGRHRHRKSRGPASRPPASRERFDAADRFDDPLPGPGTRGGRKPRALGRTLLLAVLLALAAAVAYAYYFMPASGDRSGTPKADGAGQRPSAGAEPSPDRTDPGRSPEATPGSQQPQTSAPAATLPDGYVLREDAEGFRLAVVEEWQRRPVNDAGQVRYLGGDFTLIVVPGRDSVAGHGDDPLAYQRDKERELQPFRDSSWATASGLRRIDVGRQAMAEGQFTWQDSTGREVYVRNLALIVGDRYHVIQVIGPADQREKVTEIHRQATATYRVTG
ncbi:protein kinase [Streptomyces sp. NPDC047999]|uniref:protein kinase n=1 Tax=Streptomyces sp. NPDC047999 TaxID=3365497 RepID=UPI00371401CF